jgi:hypothetical protein
MDMVKRSPYRAAQVKKLKFRNDVDFDFDQRTLCNTFYNARLFEMTHEHQNFDSFHRFNGPVDMTRSKSKVEVLLDSLHCDLTLHLLTSDLCGALHTLELDFPGTENDTCGQTIVAQMINLPALKELTLLGLNLRLEELDTLHQNVFKILDDAEAQISVMSFHDCENLHFFEDLFSSHQRKYVNSLLFDSTMIHSPRFLQNMTALNALHLVHFDTVDLSTYLNVLPETVKKAYCKLSYFKC